MKYDNLVNILYQDNLNWVYSLVTTLDKEKIEKKDKFISDPYNFNNFLVLGFYFMNLYIISNINEYSKLDSTKLLTTVITAASTYNKEKLSSVYKRNIDLKKIVEQYNSLVRKTKEYAPNDGLKARIVAVDEIYRRIYDIFNKKHFNAFIKVVMSSFSDYESKIDADLKKFMNELS